MTSAAERAEKWFTQFDTNGDGVLDQTDLHVLVAMMLWGDGPPPNSEVGRGLVSAGIQLWRGFSARAGQDEGVSRQNFTEALRSTGFLDRSAVPFQLALFDVSDTDEDGRLSLNDWMRWQQNVGVGQHEALEAFVGVDNDGDGYITREQYARYIKEFLSGS